jgi:hypothetical protein
VTCVGVAGLGIKKDGFDDAKTLGDSNGNTKTSHVYVPHITIAKSGDTIEKETTVVMLKRSDKNFPSREEWTEQA